VFSRFAAEHGLGGEITPALVRDYNLTLVLEQSDGKLISLLDCLYGSIIVQQSSEATLEETVVFLGRLGVGRIGIDRVREKQRSTPPIKRADQFPLPRR
jgi:hypothetical protein